MGDQRMFNPVQGFTEYRYTLNTKFEPMFINGLKGEVIQEITSNPNQPQHLPWFANTSDVYFKADKSGEVVQCRVYINRCAIADFDWGHQHTNWRTDGCVFEKGVVHIQECVALSDGTLYRSSTARLMTDDEITKYGAMILHFNPNVKFRP